jgi:hypothetical protein
MPYSASASTTRKKSERNDKFGGQKSLTGVERRLVKTRVAVRPDVSGLGASFNQVKSINSKKIQCDVRFYSQMRLCEGDYTQ